MFAIAIIQKGYKNILQCHLQFPPSMYICIVMLRGSSISRLVCADFVVRFRRPRITSYTNKSRNTHVRKTNISYIQNKSFIQYARHEALPWLICSHTVGMSSEATSSAPPLDEAGKASTSSTPALDVACKMHTVGKSPRQPMH